MIYRKEDIYVWKTLIRNSQLLLSFPHHGHEFDLMLLFKFAAIRIIFIIPIVFGAFCHLYQSLTKGHVYESISTLYFVNFLVMYYSANVIFLMKGDTVLQFLKSLSMMRHERLERYEKTVQYIEIFTKFVQYSSSACLTAVVLESFLRDNYCNNKEFVNDPNYICGCLVPMYLPLKKNYFFVKPITALYVYLFAISHIPIMLSSVSLYFGSVELIIMKIEELLRRLEEIDFTERNTEKVKRKLLSCAEYYIGISSLVNEMNNSLGYMFAPTHNAYNNVLMGILAYLAMKFGSIPNAIQLVIWIFVQWLSCYSGQRLDDASLLLRREVFGLSWYNIDPSLRSTFRIFQAHVDVTLHMQIKPITLMNMNNFSSILKGAYSFLMYLLKI